MQTKLWLFLGATLFFFFPLWGDTTTIILQNGLNGYDGCEDSYTSTEALNDNFHTGLDLQIFNCVP